jgi:hypothetical protein
MSHPESIHMDTKGILIKCHRRKKQSWRSVSSRLPMKFAACKSRMAEMSSSFAQ